MKLDCIKKIIQFPMETSNTRILQMFMYFRSFSVSIFMRAGHGWGQKPQNLVNFNYFYDSVSSSGH